MLAHIHVILSDEYPELHSIPNLLAARLNTLDLQFNTDSHVVKIQYLKENETLDATSINADPFTAAIVCLASNTQQITNCSQAWLHDTVSVVRCTITDSGESDVAQYKKAMQKLKVYGPTYVLTYDRKSHDATLTELEKYFTPKDLHKNSLNIVILRLLQEIELQLLMPFYSPFYLNGNA